MELRALILGGKVVVGIDEAIAHIHEYSSEHTDSILTQIADNAKRFINLNNAVEIVCLDSI